MTSELLALGAYLTALALAFLSAVVPVVNAEVLLLSYAALAGSTPASAITWAAIFAVGQMAGKCTVYWAGRGVGRLPRHRHRQSLERWEERFRRSPRAVMAFVLLSALTGLPPFFVVSALAGTFRATFPGFVMAGLVGRFVRFGAIALFPLALGHLRHAGG